MKSLRKYTILLLFVTAVVVSACNTTNKTSTGGGALCHDESKGTFVECSKLEKNSKEFVEPEIKPSGKIGIKIGDSAPDFLLYDIDGNKVRLSDFRGKQAVVLDFFATWCPYCNNEMPRLEKIVDSYGGKVQIIAIDDSKESVADVGAFREKYDFKFPMLIDLEASVAELYQISGHPYTIYINKDGVIMDKKYGSGLDEDIKARVDKIAF